jgi:CheY-like chemotaxis protein
MMRTVVLDERPGIQRIPYPVGRHPKCNAILNTRLNPSTGGDMGKTMMHGQWRYQAGRVRGYARPPRVIVAEDEADVRRMVVVALRSLGFDIVEARTGAELLDELGDALLEGDPAARPDIIISDIRMPGLTGMEILAGLRQAHWPTGIVLMTAYADRKTRMEAQQLGVTAFFEKPFDIDDLMTVVVNMAPPSARDGSERRH